MSCGYRDKILLYFYGELPEQSAAEVKRHIDACASCAGALAVLKELIAQFESFKPEPQCLSASALAAAAREPGFLETAVTGLRRSVFAGVFTAAFLFAFQLMGVHKIAQPGWNNDIGADLNDIEYGIYSLKNDMLYSSSADFDYRCADIETQKQRIGSLEHTVLSRLMRIAPVAARP